MLSLVIFARLGLRLHGVLFARCKFLMLGAGTGEGRVGGGVPSFRVASGINLGRSWLLNKIGGEGG